MIHQQDLGGNRYYSMGIYDNQNSTFHFHKSYEVLYMMEGKAVYHVNGKAKMLEAGDFAFCFPNEIHAIQSIGKTKIWALVFSAHLIPEFSKYQKGKSGLDFSFRCSDLILNYLKAHLIKEEVSDVFLIQSCLYALCSEHLRQIELEEIDGKQLSLLKSIVVYIDKNYKQDISLADLADSLGYDYFYFSKVFNKLFSVSFSEYLNIYRFHKACNLLAKGDMAIASVASESGFQSIRSFNNTFKKLAGISPCEYRELY